ncbi:alpha/beta fold hydrolase [Oceanobacillus luteolus]|uniref:Alpha/beta fold hydrolase n=1 Tax=Oceanobacillus luteolus TaxID=1274358 RepID=A0ABW4HML7_9BACI|nr:alpha/beta fold hydrolase [Oceanobacillus luteolus]MCM3740493.1 alpha/beta fold hydrolase [Oceanobacillus luteolus]
MNKGNIITGLFALLLLLGLGGYSLMPKNTKSEGYVGIPTVFVHGYKGTVNSFGNMLQRFENEYKYGVVGMTYFVNADGSLHTQHLARSNGKPLFIQVVFENNRTSFAETTNYLANVLHNLKSTYQIDTVNLVGHSMGGIVSLKYIMEYDGKAYPRVEKLVTIGSPFAGIFDPNYFITHTDRGAEDLKMDSLALRMLHTSTFPEHVKVLSIGSTGDAVAVPESVAQLRKIVPSSQLKEVMLEDETLGHSALHEHAGVDQLIYRFLWQDLAQ